MDVAGALVLLVPGLPLMAVVAAVVALGSGLPLLHREPRLGLGGKPFQLIKFRCLRGDPAGAGSIAPEDDPRLTGIGRFLRRWRLDELPQLLLVLSGRMSLVGPRPMPAAHASALPGEARALLLGVRPGLTGAGALAFLAEDAVLAGKPQPEALYLARLLPAKARVELEYIGTRSLGGDIALLLRTVCSVWSHRARELSRQRVEAILAAPDEPTAAG